jgi:hypothetical protein
MVTASNENVIVGHIATRRAAMSQDTDEEEFCDICGINPAKFFGLCAECWEEQCALEDELEERTKTDNLRPLRRL